MDELATHEYSKRAVAIPAPVSATAMLLIVAFPVVVIIVPVEVISGGNVSIRLTVANVSPVFPAKSSKVKRNDPLLVKIWNHVFIPVSSSLKPVSTATTFPLVRAHDIGVYSTVAAGGVLSCT